jgi:hypothetical protein
MRRPLWQSAEIEPLETAQVSLTPVSGSADGLQQFHRRLNSFSQECIARLMSDT